MAKTKNIHDLGTDLLNVYDELRQGRIEKSTARALASVASVVIDGLKVQIQYNSRRDSINKVSLLEPVTKRLKP